MGVDHRRLDLLKAKHLLNGADVIPVFEQKCCEGVPEGVAGGMLGDPCRGACDVDESLEVWQIGAMVETGWRRGRGDSGGRIGLPGRLGFEELSLPDPMGPPPSIITGKVGIPCR